MEHQPRTRFSACSTRLPGRIRYSIRSTRTRTIRRISLSVEGREAGYSMLLSRGVFRRGGAAEGGAARVGSRRPWTIRTGWPISTRLVHWRRVMPTINFRARQRGGQLGRRQQHRHRINAPDSRTRPGATSLVAQQGPAAPPEVIANIVDFESSLFTAQLNVAGRRTSRRRRCSWRSGGIGHDAESCRTVRSLRRMGRSRQPAAGAGRAWAGAVQRGEPWRTQLQRVP